MTHGFTFNDYLIATATGARIGSWLPPSSAREPAARVSEVCSTSSLITVNEASRDLSTSQIPNFYSGPIPVQLEPVTTTDGMEVENNLSETADACLDDQRNKENERQQEAVTNTEENVTEPSSCRSRLPPVESSSLVLSPCQSLSQKSHSTETFYSSKSKRTVAMDDDQIKSANELQRQRVKRQKIARESSSTSPSRKHISAEELDDEDHMMEKEAEELENANVISGNDNVDASDTIGDEEFHNPSFMFEGRRIGRNDIAQAPLPANMQSSRARHHVMKDLSTGLYQALQASLEMEELANNIESENKADKSLQLKRHRGEIEEKETIIVTLKDNLKAALAISEEKGEQIRKLTEEKEQAMQVLEQLEEARAKSEKESTEMKRTYQRDLQQLKDKSVKAKEALEEHMKREKEAIKQLGDQYLQSLLEVKEKANEEKEQLIQQHQHEMKREIEAMKQSGEKCLQNLREVNEKANEEKEQLIQQHQHEMESEKEAMKQLGEQYFKNSREVTEKSKEEKEQLIQQHQHEMKREKEAMKQSGEQYLQNLREVKEKAKEEKEQLIQQHQHEMVEKEKTMDMLFSNIYGKKFESEVQKILNDLVESGRMVWVRGSNH